MKFSSILALIGVSQAITLESVLTDINHDAAKSAAHAAAKFAHDHGSDPKAAVSQANATIKHYEGAKA